MSEWYALKRGQGLGLDEIAIMTAEERQWWIAKIEKENETFNKSLPGKIRP